MKIHILTLFPEMLEAIFGYSIIQRAREKGNLSIECVNIRDHSTDRHKRVDDYPYGGGRGMVMTPQPIFDAHAYVCRHKSADQLRTVYCTPKGRHFTQKTAWQLAQEEELIFLCGHYEGVDQRVIDTLVTDEISIGDYVLTGGELPAAVMVEAIARMVPGVLKDDQSFQEESLYHSLLEYPQYTRPQEFREMKVPEVLMSGHHEKIQQWRRFQAIRETLHKRPDLLENACLTDEERAWIEEMKNKEKGRISRG